MRVLAIDPGLAATGWALVDDTRLVGSGTVTTPTGSPMAERAAKIALELLTASAPLRHGPIPVTLVIECPDSAFGGKAFQGVMRNFFVSGFIAGALSEKYGFAAPVLVNPSTWTAGKGRSRERMEAKRQLAVRVFRVSGRTSEHERDALGIALWAISGGV